ncbi:MAG: dTDP-4-dehydrorhamnose reductase [Acidobacteria bacterium]|nr:dTDP-4-dehydrorhamnose reductase [Acidobacteriota bacterium]
MKAFNQADSTTPKSALITGAGGLLGACMSEHLRAANWRVIPCNHQQLDITDEEAVRRSVLEARPDVVINCAATADVDRCERDVEWAYAVNEKGVRYLARACRATHAELVHVSTDYVFDGSKAGFYTQADAPNPLSVYGQSKLAGEGAAQEELEPTYLIRTSWVFGVGGKNFGSRLFAYVRAGAKLKGVIDQTSIATYAPDLAARIAEIIGSGEHGLYHITNTGVTSWYDFAIYALELAGMSEVVIEPCNRADLNQTAPRPHHSAMRCLLSEKLGLAPLRHWRDAAVDFVREQLAKN